MNVGMLIEKKSIRHAFAPNCEKVGVRGLHLRRSEKGLVLFKNTLTFQQCSETRVFAGFFCGKVVLTFLEHCKIPNNVSPSTLLRTIIPFSQGLTNGKIGVILCSQRTHSRRRLSSFHPPENYHSLWSWIDQYLTLLGGTLVLMA